MGSHLHLIWLFLFWPMWMLSTDPQSSPETKVDEALKILEDKIVPVVTSEPEQIKKSVEDVAEEDVTLGSGNYSPVVEGKDGKPGGSLIPEFSDSGVESSGGGVNFPELPDESIIQEGIKTDEKRLDSEVVEKGDEIQSQIPKTPSQEQVTAKTETFVTPQVETIPGPTPPVEEPSGQQEEPSGRAEVDENTTTTGKTEEIPSFSEWTKLQLSKKPDQSILLQSNGGARDVKKEDGKNYASPDCGAKILLANPEAQNPSGTISSSHDEYMLNRCGVSSWLIMELCEPIRIEKIIAGNVELFSSSPKEIDVGVSDRYPTREWVKIGPLELPDARAAHVFPVNTNSTYSKFVRFQILSHHGNEHYCPLSVIRIYGKSEYEVLDQAEHAHSEDVDHSDHDSAVGEELVNNEGTNEKSVIGTAADAVISIVKKAAQVLGKRGHSSSSSDNKTSCQSVASCLSPTPNVSDVCNLKLLNFVHVNSKYFTNNSSCRTLLNTKSIGGPSQVEGFWIALFGDGILHSVCKYMSPLRDCDDQEPDTVEEAVKAYNVNATLKANATAESIITTQQPTSETTQTVAPETIATTEKPTPQPAPVVVEEEASRIQKESVFVRLTNRIKVLERNQSLSSGYLEELSQRFKKQSEESYSVSQSMKKTLNETMSKYIWLQEYTRREASFLKRSVADLRVTLWRTEMQRGFLIFVVLIQFLGIGLFCCWTRRRLSDLEEKIKTPSRPVSAPLGQPPPKESQLPILPRKRSNSHPDIMKLKKKKKKKDALKNPSDNVFSFIPHSSTTPDSLGTDSKPISPNGNIPSNRYTPPPLTPKYEADTVTVNRFGILASPSTHTINSVGNGDISPTHSNEGLTSKKLLTESNSNVATNGHKSAGSASSLDSTDGKSRKGSKKMKLKHLIPKFFDK